MKAQVIILKLSNGTEIEVIVPAFCKSEEIEGLKLVKCNITEPYEVKPEYEHTLDAKIELSK